MSILKLKYKAHKLVNTIFYLLVFVVGFLLGFASEKIDYNKLISQVLMIDNVSAYTIHTYNGYEFNEEFIYNSFKNHWTDFNLDDVSYIACDYYKNPKWYCYAYINSMVGVATSSNSRGIYFSNSPGQVGYNWTFDPTTGQYEYFNPGGTSYFALSSTSTSYVTNFDNFTKHNPNLTYDYSSNNKLDFSDVGVNLEFNENLFKDNPDFKEVCVPNNKDFAISTNNYEINENEGSYYGTKSHSSYEFIWFPYYIKGLKSYLYDNSKTDNIWIPEEDDTYFDLHPIYHYWFNSKEVIDGVWNSDSPGSFLNSFGYEDKYSYYGWYTHPFVVRYANSGLRQFSVFRFDENVEIINLDGSISNENEQYCFYIRKDYDVNLLNEDEFGDKYGDITIMEDEKLEISTSVNISNLDSKGLFEKVKLFLNEMTDSIDYVKDYIYDLYDSMPYLLKLFIISVFGLIVIKILIGMVVR